MVKRPKKNDKANQPTFFKSTNTNIAPTFLSFAEIRFYSSALDKNIMHPPLLICKHEHEKGGIPKNPAREA
jgi:hypothetical protein